MEKELVESFLVDAEEMITELEQGLMAIESDPADDQAIHRIFRAAHTLKGSAGMLGFDPLVALAHVAESVLARVRARELTVDNELTSLLLSSADAFRGMTAEAAERGAVSRSAAYEELGTALQGYLASPEAPAAAAPEKPSGLPGHKVWEISMKFRRDLFRAAQDPMLLLRDLAELGEILEVKANLDDLPAFAALDPESCYVSWKVLLSTGAARDDIDGVFLFVSADNDIKLADVTNVSGAKHLGEVADKKLGELLVEQGVVRPDDIDLALGQQKKLGEVLVDLGKVNKESLDRVLAKQAVARQARRASTIRVDTDKLDRLVNLVGEMVITVAQVNQTTRDPAASEAARIASVEALDQISRDLQGQVMSVRMVPIEETFQRFQRAVRDLSQELGKHVVLEFEGSETELDKIVIEQLADPLKHMVRNAVAHGLETPEQRIAAGKGDTGRICLRAAQRQGKVVIEVADDGRGIDPDRVLRKAQSLGLAPKDAKLTEKQIFDFIFQPGFSTAAKIDEISGRGVGLDVVYRNVCNLRGMVDVQSVLGQGTTFRITLPLTLAIIEAMNVQVGPKTLSIPLLSVVELIAARSEEIHTVEGQGELVDVRGEYLPMIRLREVLDNLGEDASLKDSAIVILENEARKFGVLVDRVLGMEQTVVKPLEKAFSLMTAMDREYRKPQGISGATILGDGNVALILDVPGLERMAFEEDPGEARA